VIEVATVLALTSPTVIEVATAGAIDSKLLAVRPPLQRADC